MLIAEKQKKHFLVQGSINPQVLADLISKHSGKKNIGAHEIFLGQVRSDLIDGKTVIAIEYSAYSEMAEKEIVLLRETIITKYNLTCAHLLHSVGKINAGEICFCVF